MNRCNGQVCLQVFEQPEVLYLVSVEDWPSFDKSR